MIGSPRKNLPARIVEFYDRGRFEFTSQLGKWRQGKKKLPSSGQRFLNLGAGPDPTSQYPSFLNTDHYCWRGQVDFCHDLRDPLPFQDDDWEGILMHHVLEHLSADDGKALLAECARVLKPGGVVRIAVPDCGLACRLYAAASSGDQEAKEKLLTIFPKWFGEYATPMEVVHEFFYSHPQNQHLNSFDEKTLGLFLSGAGFEDITAQDFSTSLIPELAVGNQAWSDHTLYMEGKLPPPDPAA